MIPPVVLRRPVGDKSPMAMLHYGADCREALRLMPSESVHCVVTSPPYWGLREYEVTETTWGDGDWRGHLGLEPTPEMYVEHLVEVFREVWRVLREDGTLWLNLGDSYSRGRTGRDDERRMAQDPEHWKRSPTGGPSRDRNRVPGLKEKDLVGIPWMVAFALRSDGWFLRNDVVWCLSGGTRVYARRKHSEGPMTIHELVRLNPADVQLWNGTKWVQVLGWSETQRPESTFEIQFRNGERVGCTPGHEWPTKRGLVTAEGLRVGDVVEVCRLPEPLDPEQPTLLPDELIGWFVGTYLADGSKGDDGAVIQIASHTEEHERFTRLVAIAQAYGSTCTRHQTSENGCTINLRSPALLGILDQYLRGNTAKHKHLDPRCWRRNDNFLEALMRGYLAGDSHREEVNSRWKLDFCQNDRLAADLRTVAARLGWSLRLRRQQHMMEGKKFPGWGGDLKITRGEHWNSKADGEIVTIRKSRARKFWDIGLVEEPHLFALASGILTHNSKANCLPESVEDRCTRAHEYVFHLSKAAHYYYDLDAIREPHTMRPQRRPDGHKRRRPGSLLPEHTWSGTAREEPDIDGDPRGRNKRTVWSMTTVPYPEAHFATFPPDLPRTCILAGTSDKGCCPTCGAPWRRVVETSGGRDWRSDTMVSKGIPGDLDGDGSHKRGQSSSPLNDTKIRMTVGWQPSCPCPPHDPAPCTVLDPFSGSGTTGMVALALGRNYVGIDLSERYLGLAARRIDEDWGDEDTDHEDLSGGLLDLLLAEEP